MTDTEEYIAEINGLKSTVAELKRENALLRRSHIDLRTELAEERGLLAQEQARTRALEDQAGGSCA